MFLEISPNYFPPGVVIFDQIFENESMRPCFRNLDYFSSDNDIKITFSGSTLEKIEVFDEKYS